MLASLIFNHINILTIFFISLLYTYNFYLEHKNSTKTNYIQFVYLVISISSAFAHYYTNPTFYIFDGDISKTENIVFSIVLGLVFFSQAFIRNYKKAKHTQENFSKYINKYEDTDENYGINILNVNFQPNHNQEDITNINNKNTQNEATSNKHCISEEFLKEFKDMQSEIKNLESLLKQNQSDVQDITINLTKFLNIVNKKVNKIIDDINQNI